MEASSIEARVEQVTVYASGARVRRVTALAGPIAPRVRIVGLPAAVIDDTVRVEIDGPAIATSVRVGLEAPPADRAAAEDTPEVRAAERRVALAETEVERIGAAIDQLAAAPVIEADRSDDPPAAWDAVVAARRAVIAIRSERELALREHQLAARRALEDARRALEAAADRDRRAGSARGAKLHEVRKYVELELVASATGDLAIHLEYLTAAARWAPSYVARLDGERAIVELRAVVAQDTGEDWTAVPLRLSTAEPARFAALPELAAQRIGRRQHEPQRTGFRPPPAGAEALYADYDRELRPPAARVPDGSPSDRGGLELAEEVWDEDSSRAKEAFQMPMGGMAPGAPPPPPQAAPTRAVPMPMMQAMAKSGGIARRLLARSDSAPANAAPPQEQPAAPPPRLDYANLKMAPPGSRLRGQLVAQPPDRDPASESAVATRRARVEALVLPAGCATDWVHTYDYAFATDGAVDVRSDGAWHSIAVTAKPSTAKLRHVSVPREQADVFRIAAVENPFVGPLLPGPIDVYDRGRFLITSRVEYAPPGATVELGLGVDPAVKIARNTEFREEVGGVLRGALKLIHGIAIDIENLTGRPIDLEVRERVPVIREGDDEVEVAVTRAEPPWERWTPDPDAPKDSRLRGGQRWRVALAPGAKQTLRAGYEVKIAGKHELVGGNRRES